MWYLKGLCICKSVSLFKAYVCLDVFCFCSPFINLFTISLVFLLVHYYLLVNTSLLLTHVQPMFLCISLSVLICCYSLFAMYQSFPLCVCTLFLLAVGHVPILFFVFLYFTLIGCWPRTNPSLCLYVCTGRA